MLSSKILVRILLQLLHTILDLSTVGEPVGNPLGARWEPKKPFVLDCAEGVRILGEMKVFLDEMFK